jgi:hypothetical protein
MEKEKVKKNYQHFKAELTKNDISMVVFCERIGENYQTFIDRVNGRRGKKDNSIWISHYLEKLEELSKHI